MNRDIQKWRIDQLENDLVKLRLLRGSDFQDVLKMTSDPIIWSDCPVTDKFKKEVVRNYFDQAMSSTASFIVIDKVSKKEIGCARFYEYNPSSSSVVIGVTFLSREYWGITFEFCLRKLLLDFAFQFVKQVSFLVQANDISISKGSKRLNHSVAGKERHDQGNRRIQQFQYTVDKDIWKFMSMSYS